ncbi:hypothetical protein [Nocardiopsis sp. TSRI0078]|uniref:hypothetical protein n=2 Tax=unclassified Nocardiopsis TaxID=2649073 RepID=UPI0011614309|nr:hypothetical protein [Nocardiopsis sp. TSRI0078]
MRALTVALLAGAGIALASSAAADEDGFQVSSAPAGAWDPNGNWDPNGFQVSSAPAGTWEPN